MDASRFQIIFFVVMSFFVSVLAFLIFSPFLTILALAATAAVVLYPLYKYFLKLFRGYSIFASLLSVLAFLVVVFLPIVFLTVQLLGETRQLYTALAFGQNNGIEHLNGVINDHLHRIAPDATLDIRAYLAEISSWVIAHIGNLFSITLGFIANFVFAVIALFYFLKDGESFKAGFRLLSPLPDASDNLIIETLAQTIKSVLLTSNVTVLCRIDQMNPRR